MAKANEVENDSLLFDEQASAPTTPATGFWRAYFKSDGLYVVDDAGNETGPLAPTGGAATFVGARVYHDANQSIANNTITSLALNTERFDTDAFHDAVTNNSRLTVPAGKAGKYLIIGNVAFAANATGQRQVRILLNGATVIARTVDAGTIAGDGTFILSTIYDLAEADYVELQAYQTSGGALNVVATAAVSPEFMLTKL